MMVSDSKVNMRESFKFHYRQLSSRWAKQPGGIQEQEPRSIQASEPKTLKIVAAQIFTAGALLSAAPMDYRD